MYVPKKKRSLHRQVIDYLGHQIIAGKFPPGAALPTAEELSSQLGVSRTVTREAIKVLEEKGLLKSRPKAGIRVQPSSQWKLLDPEVMLWHARTEFSPVFLANLFEVRRIVEPAAAKMAAKYGTIEEVDAIAIAYRKMDRSGRDYASYKAANKDFHNAVFQATHNPVLIHLAKTLNLDLDIGRDAISQRQRNIKDTLPLHKDILEAIRAQDGVKAYTVMLLLINQLADYMAENLPARRRSPRKPSKRGIEK